MGPFRDLVGDLTTQAAGETGGEADAASHPLDPVPTGRNQAIKESPGAGSGAAPVTVRIDNLDLEITVPTGTTLLDAAIEADTDINWYCGGLCSCGSCRLEIVAGEVSPIEDMEESTLDLVGARPADRLACQTRALGDVVVRVLVD